MKATAPAADVALLLEGTYPFVLGGVSAWVHQIIRGLPELRFALIYIGSRPDNKRPPVYQIPENVCSLTEIYLHEPFSRRQLRPARLGGKARVAVYRAFADWACDFHDREKFWQFMAALDQAGDAVSFGNLLADPEAWNLIKAVYQKIAPEESFIDFYWTVRAILLPLWAIWIHRASLPKAYVYHAISTGFAGALGALAARRSSKPFLLTEHGIYVKERVTEIHKAEWIHEPGPQTTGFAELGKLKQIWIEVFKFLAGLAYENANRIVTLFQGNAQTQVEFGADRDKIVVIPNGIDPNSVPAGHGVPARSPSPLDPKTVGFIGRVVPIKDIKTLLRAAQQVCAQLPKARFLIIGPTDEDPDYFQNCQRIVQLFGLAEQVEFTGPKKTAEILPILDALVLTSISEGLPLVILEALAAGVPVVASDVGACRELLFGRTAEDKALGRAGILTKIMSPSETASALVSILSRPDIARVMAQVGQDRVRRYYTQTLMLDEYRKLYLELAGASSDAAELADGPLPVSPGTVQPFVTGLTKGCMQTS